MKWVEFYFCKSNQYCALIKIVEDFIAQNARLLCFRARLSYFSFKIAPNSVIFGH